VTMPKEHVTVKLDTVSQS